MAAGYRLGATGYEVFGAGPNITTGPPVTTLSGSTFLAWDGQYLDDEHDDADSNVSDSKSNAYVWAHPKLAYANYPGASARASICWSGNGGSGHTFTSVMPAGYEGTLLVVELTGVTRQQDHQTAHRSASTSIVSPTATASQQAVAVATIWGYSSDTSLTVSDGFEIVAHYPADVTSLHGALAVKVISGAGPVSCTWTISDSQEAEVSMTIYEGDLGPQVGGSIELTCTGGALIGGAQTATSVNAGVSFVARGTVATSTANGTTVSPSYSALGVINPSVHQIYLFVWQKPSTANGGTVTTPNGFTLVDSLTGAGGYGSTLGSNTGNTNLFVYKKDTVTGSESGTLAITVGASNVASACFVMVEASEAATFSEATSKGSDTTAGNLSVAGGSNLDVAPGDLVIATFAYPTNLATYSAQALSETGVTFGTVAEAMDAGVTTGNRLGAMMCHGRVSGGIASAAPTLTATTGGTTTNARGPGIFLRIRATSTSRSGTSTSALSAFGSVAAGLVTLTGAASNSCSALASAAIGGTGDITGTAESALASLAASCGGSVVVSGSATCALASLEDSASGSVTVAGSATGSAQPLTDSAVGAITATGTAASSTAPLASSGSGGATLSGAAATDLSVASSAASGTQALGVSGAATGALAQVESTASGLAGVIGTAASSTAPLASSGSGGATLSGAAEGALSQPWGSAAGTQSVGVTGTASGALAPLESAGSGLAGVIGVAASAAVPLTSSGSGGATLSGSATAALSTARSTASGGYSVDGSALDDLSALASSGIGVQSAGITGNLVSGPAPMVSAATGIETFTGAASDSLTSIGSSVAGALVISGVASSAFVAPVANASGNQQMIFSGSAASRLASMGSASFGGLTCTGSAVTSLRSLSIVATGNASFVGVVSSELSPLQSAVEAYMLSSIEGVADTALRSFAGLGVGYTRPLQVNTHGRAEFVNVHISTAAIFAPPVVRAMLLDEGIMAQTLKIGIGGAIEAQFDFDTIVEWLEVGIKRVNTPSTEQTFKTPAPEIELLATPAEGYEQSYRFTSPPILIDGVWQVEVATNFGIVVFKNADGTDQKLTVTVVKSTNRKLNEDVTA